MANRINNRKYNKLLSYRNHYYWNGSQMQNDPYRLNGRYSTPAIVDGMGGAQNPSQGYENPQLLTTSTSPTPPTKQPGLFGNLGATLKEGFKSGALNGAATAVGGMVGGAIGGGLESGVGNAIGSLGNIASTIPGPWGAVAGAGLKVIGGLTNRAFGSKMNQENIANVEGTINRLNSFQSNASDFDALANTWENTALGNNFSNSYIGKDGLFSNKAKKKARELRNQMELANAFAENVLQNNANNITKATMNNLEANYAALGGFLNQYADGGSIHINPENRGKFNATKKRTGKTTEELTHSKNPLTRKRAIFAQNAAKWHHAFGGELNTNGGDFSTGLMFIDEGGTHESNPYEGVPMGVAPDGKPNLVEEGEAIYNDYVFSNRLTVPKSVRNKYKLRGAKDLTFADAVKQISKSATERPNDPISQETLHEIMSDLAVAQEEVRQQNQEGQEGVQYAHGGKMGTLYDDGNYLQFYTPQEKLMRRWQDQGILPTYTLTAPQKKFNVQDVKTKDFTFKTPSLVDNGTFEERWMDENVKPTTLNMPSTPISKKGKKNSDITWLRYAPVAGAAIGLSQGLFSKPDYISADRVFDAANYSGTIPLVDYIKLGNYLEKKYFDRDFYINKLNAQAGATRRALANLSRGNRGSAMAGILAADYNAQGRLGDLARQAEEYNAAQRERVETFNRGTNQMNSEMGLKAAMTNQEAGLKARSSRLSGIAQAMAMRDAIDARRSASLNANFTNLFDSLGDIGREAYARNMIVSNPALYYDVDSKGNITYKNGYDKLSDAAKDQINTYAATHATNSNKAALGGYLTRRNRRRNGKS